MPNPEHEWPVNPCNPCEKAKEIDETASDVKEIKVGLLGNEYQEGMFDVMQRTKKRVSRIERVLWTASGGVIVGFAIFKIIVPLITGN
jgi:hypothetical protein